LQGVLTDRDQFIRSVSERIRAIASRLNSENKASLDFHNSLQRRVTELGAEFGFRGVREYPVWSPGGDVRGLADVAWMAKRRLVAIFEIDSTPKIKSVKKLTVLDAPFRFWIYYGHGHYLSMTRSVDRMGTVEVIRLQNIYF